MAHRNILKTVMLAALLLLVAPSALANEVGDRVEVFGYCTEEVAMSRLAEAVIEDGWQGYLRIIGDADVPCYDGRLLENINTVKLILTERLFVMQLPNGESYQVWKVRDFLGKMGYTWLLIRTEAT